MIVCTDLGLATFIKHLKWCDWFNSYSAFTAIKSFKKNIITNNNKRNFDAVFNFHCPVNWLPLITFTRITGKFFFFEKDKDEISLSKPLQHWKYQTCKNTYVYFFLRGHGNESCNLIGSQPGTFFPISALGHGNTFVSWISERKRERKKKVICGRRVGPYSETLWPWAEHSRPRSQFLSIPTSQPVNNIFKLYRQYNWLFKTF